MSHADSKANTSKPPALFQTLLLLLCLGAGATQANVTFQVGNTNGATNAQVVVPIRASQFANISAFSFSLHWNTNIAAYVGVEQFALPGMTNNNFALLMNTTGTLAVVWDEPNGGATNLPTGAMVFGVRFRLIGPTGAVSPVTIDGTPTSLFAANNNLEQVPVSAVNGSITVIEVNSNAPVLGVIGSKTIDEGSQLSFTASATDASLPAQTLTYSLSNAPSGAAINASSGVFNWTPSETQGPGIYSVTVRATDNGSPVLSAAETISISVNEVNLAPVLGVIGSKSATQGNLLTFTATATDPDVPVQSLAYSLVGGPVGASIHPTSGVFTWTPNAMQGGGSYPVTIVVSDGSLTDSEVVSINVTVIAAVITTQPTNQTLTAGQTASFSVTATGSVLNYQWRRDGTNIPGATSASYVRASAQVSDAGVYSVTVSNELGAVVSSNASLIVIPLGTPVVRSDGLIVVSNVTRVVSTALTLVTAFPQGYIFYTLDGSAPTFASPLYTGPITINRTVVVRALALSSDFSQSAEAPAVTIFILPYTMNVTSGGAGAAAVSPAQSYYASNSLVTLTATPDGGWSFLRWGGDASGSSNPLGLTVHRSLQVQAVFGTSLLTNMVGSGRIEITPGGPVPYGSTVELRAVPGPGQKFVAWGSAVAGTNNPRLFTVTQPGPTVAALFASGPAGFPVITNQPSPRVVSAGGSFTLSVGAGGTGPLRYQWRRNGAALAGATNATLDLSSASGTQAGGYDVVVTGPGGTVVSERASVLVTMFDMRPVVSLLGAAGTGFRVDYTDDLDGGPWLWLTNGVLAAERQEVIDFTSTNRARRFYRTVVEP